MQSEVHSLTVAKLPRSVTISVWNGFHSPQLVAGLSHAGIQVTYHTTARQSVNCNIFARNLSGAFFDALARRGLFPRSIAHAWSRIFVDQKALCLARKSDAFWGWSGCSLRGLRAASRAGKPAILERGSTHCVWQSERVVREHRRLGLSTQGLSNPAEITYDLAEYEAADVICVPSRFVLKTFLEKGVPREKIFLNPYGVDFDFWSATSNRRHEGGPFTFLWAATLMPRKGIAVLLEAWRMAALRDARLHLVGSIEPCLRSYLRTLPAGVTLTPFMDHKRLREEMGRSHVYVLPSLEEGMARSVLEAAAAGLPVLITEETGATDILAHGRDAWVVPGGNHEALAETLIQIYRNPEEVARRGTSAQTSVYPYTWDAYGARASAMLDQRLLTGEKLQG